MAENMKRGGQGTDSGGIRPGFLSRGSRGGGEEGSSWADKERAAERGSSWAEKERAAERGGRDEAAANLREAEENAANEGSPIAGSGLSAASAGERRGGVFTGVGKSAGDKKGKKKAGSFLKRKGPMGLIFALILGTGGFMMGTQSLMPMAIEEMILEKFNSIGISTTMASDAWLDVQLNQGIKVGDTQTGKTGASLFGFSEYQVQSFESHGLKVVQDVGNLTQITAILYQKNGLWVPVVGSDILLYNGYSESDLINAIKGASGLNNIGKPISAQEALKDTDFKNPYTAASRTWRGGISGWFDNIMSSFTETKLSINRNRWVKWVAGNLNDIADAFKETGSSVNLSKTSDRGVERDHEVKVLADDGTTSEIKDEEITRVTVENEDGIDVDSENVSDTSITATNATLEKVTNVLNSKAVKAASAIGAYGCAVIEGLMSIYTVVSAYQSLQFLNLISGFLEAVDKVKAGNGSNSPIHEYGENLTTPGTTLGDDGGVAVSGRTAVQSAGFAWLFSNIPISQDNASVRNVNFEAVMSGANVLFDNIETTAEAYEACGYVKAGVAAVDLATTIISFIPLFGQGIKAVQLTVKESVKIAIKAAVKAVLYAIIPIAAKNLTKMLIQDAATEWFGEDLGNALISGANKYLGGNGTSGAESPASEEKVRSYISMRDVVIAEEAEYQRSIRSPFDMTSKYTFLGSLVHAAMPLVFSGNSVMSKATGVANLMTSSIVGLLPTAMAIGEHDELASVGDCPLLESTGAVGDAFCNPYIITDTSTIFESPIAINDIVHRIGGGSEIASTSDDYGSVVNANFDEDGHIKPDSNLARYIVYCGQRTSQYGIKDAAIASRITGSDSATSKLIGYIPLLNDVQDIVNGLSEELKMDWVNGSACVASSENKHWENEYKYYQRFIENERLLENMDPDYTSSVTKLGMEYYEANPVDDSFEGQLARFSGMSKEDVVDTLALLDYYNYVAQYDAGERYAFGGPVVDWEDNGAMFDNENVLAGAYILTNDIVYADVRNRVNLV